MAANASEYLDSVIASHNHNSKNRFRWILLFVALGHAWALLCLHFVADKKQEKHEIKVALNSKPDAALSNSSDHKKERTGFSLSHEPYEIASKTLPQMNPIRTKTISSMTLGESDRAYFERWQTYIEHVGNEVYAKMPESKQLQGDLRLLVGINKDGTVNKVILNKSSGSKQLDKTAIQIVQNAAPFEPLPAEIAEEVDVLEIVRTWQFRNSA